MITTLDRILMAADNALRTVSGSVQPSRPTPGPEAAPIEGDDARRHVAGLMRVDHAGEVCAQALYVWRLRYTM